MTKHGKKKCNKQSDASPKHTYLYLYVTQMENQSSKLRQYATDDDEFYWKLDRIQSPYILYRRRVNDIYFTRIQIIIIIINSQFLFFNFA